MAHSLRPERRKQVRIATVTFEVHLLLRRFWIVPARVRAQVLDISAEGLALCTGERLQVGQEAILHVEARSALGAVVINTLPVRIQSTQEQDQQARYGASFEFLEGRGGAAQRHSVQRLLALMRSNA